jgi:hypothetical protein
MKRMLTLFDVESPLGELPVLLGVGAPVAEEVGVGVLLPQLAPVPPGVRPPQPQVGRQQVVGAVQAPAFRALEGDAREAGAATDCNRNP